MREEDPFSTGVNFIQVNSLCQQFIRIRKCEHTKQLKQPSIDLALNSLDLMEEFKALHPCHSLMTDFLASEGNTKYSQQWIDTIKGSSIAIVASGRQYIEELESAIDTSNITIREVMEKLKSSLIVLIIEARYEEALQMLGDITSMFQFSSQPSDEKVLEDNAFLEYQFYHFVAKVFNVLWFIDDEQDSTENYDLSVREGNRTTSGIFKILKDSINRINFYYTKNEFLLIPDNEQEHESEELYYYWMIRWLYAMALFKKGNMMVFIQEVEAILSLPSTSKRESISILRAMGVIKTNLLVLFQIAMILTRPFKELRLKNQKYESLLNFIEDDEGSLQSEIYMNINLPLSEGKYNMSKICLSDPIFTSMLNSAIGPLLPLPVFKASKTFLEYLVLMIDFKSFLVMISVIKRIPRTKVLSKLGYHENDDNSVIFENLLSLIYVLNLGHSGIGFDYNADYFYNYESLPHDILLTQKVKNLTVDLEAESVASLMKGVLVEKVINSDY